MTTPERQRPLFRVPLPIPAVFLFSFIAMLPLVNGFPFFRDSGEFLTTLSTAGVAHPTGFPLTHVLAGLFLALPLGPIPFRLALMSATAGALAVTMAVAIVRLFHQGQHSRSHWFSILAVLMAPAALACNSIWYHAVNVEVYIPALALNASLLYLALRTGRIEDVQFRTRLLLIGALLGGLSLGLHITNVMVFAIVAAFVLARLVQEASQKEPLSLKQLRQAPVLLGFGLLGALVLLYLPIRAATVPPVNWGNPVGLTGIARHLSGQSIRVSFSNEMMQFDAPHIQTNLSVYLHQLWNQCGSMLPLTALGIAGGILQKRNRPGVLLVLLLLAADTGFSVFINPMAQRDLQTSTFSFWLVTLLSMLGSTAAVAAVLRTKAGRPGALAVSAVAIVLVWASPITSLGLNQRHARSSPVAMAWGVSALQSTQPDGMLLTGGDDLSGLTLYHRYVENRRPDVLPVIRQMICEPSFSDPLYAHNSQHNATSILQESSAKHCVSGDDESEMHETWVEILRSSAQERVPIRWEPGVRALEIRMPEYLHIELPTYALHWDRRPPPVEDLAAALEDLRRRFALPHLDSISGNVMAEGLRLSSATLMTRLASKPDPEQLHLACQWLDRAGELAPHNCFVFNNLSVCRLRQGRLAQSLAAANQAVSLCPLHLNANINLLRIRFLQQDLEGAVDALTAILDRFGVSTTVTAKLKKMAEEMERVGRPKAANLLRSFIHRLGE